MQRGRKLYFIVRSYEESTTAFSAAIPTSPSFSLAVCFDRASVDD